MAIDRLPEPELMQDLEQVRAYSEADFCDSEESLMSRLEDYLLKKGKILNSESLILDLGCGPGNITERLSSKWPLTKIIGIDGSQAMLAIARSRTKMRSKTGDPSKIHYCCWDVSSIAEGKVDLEKPVDLIVSNSFLHHLHDPSLFWKALRCLTSKRTVHFHRDLCRPSTVEEAIALQKTYLSNAPNVLSNDYLASLRAAFTVEEVEEQVNSERLDQLNVYGVEDSYLEVDGTF